jgi:hypothetical protein
LSGPISNNTGSNPKSDQFKLVVAEVTVARIKAFPL